MNIPRRAVEVFAASTLACALVLGICVSSAYAGPIQNFKDCIAAGGSLKACCAGAGGTYDKTDNGAESCVIVEKKASSLETPPQTIMPANLIAILAPPRPLIMLEVGPAGAGCDPNTVGCP